MAHPAPAEAKNGTSVRTAVAIVGAGPVGLALALGLASHGVRSILVERNGQPNTRSRAPGIHLRTREILRRWQVEERLLAAGTLRERMQLHTQGSGTLSIDYSILEPEADRPGVLFLEQARTEELLLDAVRETGLCEVRFASEAVGLEQDSGGVRLVLRQDGSEHTIEAEFAVGCDGASSFTRAALDLPFDGSTYAIRALLADIKIKDERTSLPWPRIWNGRGGLTVAARLPDGLWRLMHLERGRPDADEAVHGSEIEEHVRQTHGRSVPFEIEWADRFRLHMRSAPTYRVGRVLLAGDAAHIHSPAGGLGMNAGIQDAHNLAWKLAAALHGGDTERLLASYDVERRPVTVEKVSRHADYMTRGFLQLPAALRTPIFSAFRLFLAIPSLRRLLLRRMTMIDFAYRDSPLLRTRCKAAGRRLPNPRLRRPDGRETRLYDLAPNAAFLIHVADVSAEEATLPLPVIRVGDGAQDEPAGLLRRITAGRDGWILVRPDLHIAWAGPDARRLYEIAEAALGSGRTS